MVLISTYYLNINFFVIFYIKLCAISSVTDAKVNYSYIVRNILNFTEHEYDFHHVSIITFDKEDTYVRRMVGYLSSSPTLSQRVIYTSVHLPTSTRNSSEYNRSLSRNILAVASSSNSSNWPLYLNMLAKSNLKSSILFLTGKVELQKLEIMYDMLNNLSKNSLFYMAYQLKDLAEEMLWYRVITLEGYSKSVINLIEFDSFGRLIENYDMQGLHIVSIALSWAPYFTLYNCTEKKTNCSSEGYLTDAMNILGEMMNFTWESHGEIEDNWGTTSISGPSNSSGVWGGVVGNVFSGKYQLSIR